MAKTVKVGPIVYEVREVAGLLDAGTSIFGEVKHSDCEILIEAGNAAQQRRQTLWHEIVHVVLSQAGYRKESKDEGLVEALSHGIMGVVQDNPWLVESEVSDGGKGAG